MPKQKYQKIITALLLCLSILLIVAGCSSDSAQKSNSTAAYTVTDSQGHKLYFKEKPQRIISMSISTDEILIDLVPSSRIAAFSRLVDDPGISNIVERAQSVGSRVDGQSSEAIMALHPDLILIPDFVKPEVIQSLRDMNLQVYVYKTPKSMDDVRQCIRFLGEPGLQGERFIDNERITGTIDEMVDEAVDFVNRNSRHSTIIDDKGKRADRDEYPLKAVREAILNALVHRDYSIHSENVPVRLEIYRNRLEIISSGGLYGKLTIDSLGKVRPDTRNSALANILELMQVTENRYSGIPTIYHELQKAQLPPPAFCIRHGEFVVTFKSKISQVYDAPYATVSSVQEEQEQYNGQRAYSIEERLIEFCTVPRSRQEIIEFLGFSRYYSMSKIVQPLIDDGKIALTLPDKPKSSKQRYVRR